MGVAWKSIHTTEEKAMYRTIVVGYDGTDNADDGLALAGQLARLTGARLLLAFAGEDAEDALERGLAQLPYGVRSDTRALSEDSPAQALEELAQNEHADLIVIGSTALGPVGRLVIGSVGERLLYGSPCAVAVAPKGFANTAPDIPEKIGVCWDGSPESELALDAAIQLAGIGGGELHLLTAIDPNAYVYASYPGVFNPPDQEGMIQTAEANLGDGLARVPQGVAASGEVVVGYPARALPRRAAEAKVDLLVAGSRGYGPMRRVLLGGVSERLIRKAHCPVVIVPRCGQAADPPVADLALTSARDVRRSGGDRARSAPAPRAW
jgi:nucleotide-binding universal stress UspA family protein